MSRMDRIIKLILREAKKVNKTDPVARIYSVETEIGHRLIKIIEQIREQERCQKQAKKKIIEPARQTAGKPIVPPGMR